ncbi:hypothetical protein pipiens_004786 [Culex pipiens pipiens]|uniref:Uncharacterized protein n=1 Tax=Culex pipiens pipiens TaxID=38569 RepID=A0ABD1CF10_CULPP
MRNLASIIFMICCSVVLSSVAVRNAPLEDSSEEDIPVRDWPSTTYKYADVIGAYTFSPFAPKTTPTTTTTTTPAPTTTNRPWWKIFG